MRVCDDSDDEEDDLDVDSNDEPTPNFVQGRSRHLMETGEERMSIQAVAVRRSARHGNGSSAATIRSDSRTCYERCRSYS